MFSRIFNIHPKKVSTPEDNEKLRKEKCDEFQGTPRLPKLEKANIRVLIFKDCEWKADKTLLFDSDAIISVQHDTPEKEKCCKLKSVNNCASPAPKYQLVKPNGDVKMLGEMIFGSVAMAYKGSVLKVHLMRTPPQLMMTKVFALRSRSAGVNFCDNELIIPMASSMKTPEINITGGSGSMDSRDSSPTDMRRTYSNPIGMKRQALNRSCNSLYASNASSQSTWSIASADGLTRSSCVLSLSRSSLHSPCGSYKRRYVRSKRTSLDSSHIWRTKSELSDEMRSTYKQQPKIGVGIIFKLWDCPEDNKRFQDYFFSHYTLFEAHLQVLRVKIEKSFYLRQKFVDAAMNAIECFKDDVLSLCYAPRILEPVWLNLMVSIEQAYHNTVDKFIKSFINMAAICETKENNYFLSILLTAVLTHHASWVATVMSSGSEAKRAYLDKHSSRTLDILAKCHPYNPLWAQLCDLYGSNGSPVKLTRTIIIGKNSEIVCELLYVLSYFIRCSEVKENVLYPSREKEALYRFSGSSWNESHLSITPNSVRSWIDANDVLRSKFDETYDDNHSDIRHVDCDSSAGGNEVTCQQLPELNFDVNICYCSKIKNIDNVERKNLLNRMNLRESDGFVDNRLACCSANHQTSIQVEFCETCRNLQKYLLHDHDDLCHHCTQTKLSNYTHEKKEKDVKKVLFSVNTKMATFKCYCCTEGDKVNQDVQTVTIDHTEEDFSSEIDITPRARNMSDPVDCVIGSKFKTGLLRNSTTSQDSGTEMACSVASSAHDLDSADSSSLSRNDSICSRDGHDNQILPDMDSDYYSVDNEHVASTMIDTIYMDVNQDSEHCKVSKSCSTTTLKEASLSLSTSLERNDHVVIKEECDDLLKDKLDDDLQMMNLTELPLLRTSSRRPRKHSRCIETDSITFGKSLFAGYSQQYLPNVVLQGVKTLDTKRLATDLQNTVKHSVLDEQVTDALCIVADTDNWTCDLWSFSKRIDPDHGSTRENLQTSQLFASALVSSMIESTKELWDINMAPHFCLLHLEEQLKDIYNRSKVYDMYRLNNRDGDTFMNSFGYHANDIELLEALSTANDTQMMDDSLL